MVRRPGPECRGTLQRCRVRANNEWNVLLTGHSEFRNEIFPQATDQTAVWSGFL